MERVCAGWLGILLIGLAVGCATTSEPVSVSYDSSSESTVYETGLMELHDVNLTSGLSRRNGLYIQVVGRCAGEQCAPSDYTIVFGKEGFQPVQLSTRDIALSIGSETMWWEDPQSRSVDRGSMIRSGTFARVELTAEQLSTLASVSSVQGSVGDVGFSIPYEERAPLRALLSRLSEGKNENGREEGG